LEYLKNISKGGENIKKIIFYISVFLLIISSSISVSAADYYLNGISSNTTTKMASLFDDNLATGITPTNSSELIDFRSDIGTQVRYVYINSTGTGTLNFYNNSGTKVHSINYNSTTTNYVITALTFRSVLFANVTGQVNEVEFHTNSPVTIDPPGVNAVSPANGRIDVGIDDSVIITFNDTITPTGTYRIEGVETTNTAVNNIITMKPKSSLSYDTPYNIYVSGVVGANGKTMIGSFTSTFRTSKDTTPVEVMYIKPPPDAENIPIDQVIEIKFSKVIDPNTISNVSVKNGTTVVSTTSSLNGDLLKLTFNEALLNETRYTIEIQGVKDTIGNELSTPLFVNFTTIRDTTELILLEYSPPSGIIPLVQVFQFKFNKNVDPESLRYIFQDSEGNDISATVNVTGNIVKVLPNLQAGKKYTFTLIEGKTLSGPITPINISMTFEVMTTSGMKDMDDITISTLGLFNTVKLLGVQIVVKAIVILLYFIAVVWLWRETKKWLSKTKK
jgi:hypothetical protein